MASCSRPGTPGILDQSANSGVLSNGSTPPNNGNAQPPAATPSPPVPNLLAATNSPNLFPNAIYDFYTEADLVAQLPAYGGAGLGAQSPYAASIASSGMSFPSPGANYGSPQTPTMSPGTQYPAAPASPVNLMCSCSPVPAGSGGIMNMTPPRGLVSPLVPGIPSPQNQWPYGNNLMGLNTPPSISPFGPQRAAGVADPLGRYNGNLMDLSTPPQPLPPVNQQQQAQGPPSPPAGGGAAVACNPNLSRNNRNFG